MTGHEALDSQRPLSDMYATHILLCKNQPVALLDDAISDAVAFCAGATVTAAAESAGELRDKRVLVRELGKFGMIACDAAIQSGASEVYAADPNSKRRGWAEAIEGVKAFDPIEIALDKDSIDVAFDFSGANAGVMVATNSLDIGGRAVLAGSVANSANIESNLETLVRKWQSISGVHDYEPQHLDQEAGTRITSVICG